MLNKLIPKAKEVSESELERGFKQLSRLSTVMDVLFALMIFNLFYFLPRPEVDNFDASEIQDLFSAYSVNFLVILVGVILSLLYWNLSNKQTGNLERTDATHATLSILHVICLMFYLYFIRLDMEFDGARLALQMESIFLALAGFLSVYAYAYAYQRGYVSKSLNDKEQRLLSYKFLSEPITALLTLPFTYFGPDAWTLSWLLMIPVSFILKKVRIRRSQEE